MADLDLELDFEVDSVQEEDDEDSMSSYSLMSSDDDQGEIGEIDDDLDEAARQPTGADATDGDAAAVLGAGAQAYLHEPEQRLPQDAERQNFGDARPRGNLDNTRLDPNNTENWCKCGGHCEVLPSFGVGDCICCREIPKVVAEADMQSTLCITQAPSFHPAILDPISLYIAWQHFTEKWRRQARSFAARNNEKYRYVAYRQFVRWCWGILGKDIRVQLPACVQAKIKKTYPDGAGNYRGTILRRLDI
eukprot:XP_011679170.1 PREDICTED: uncharacterized protein LOC105445373 [Strongylocentrotus purpuratus]